MPKRPMRNIKNAEYNGITFKSNLETTWAHHFDCIGLIWRYEPCRILLGGADAGMRRYTPDFSLPFIPALIEVKPDDPTDTEFLRAGIACEIIGSLIYFVCGEPGKHTVFCHHRFAETNRFGFFPAKQDELPFQL